MEASGGLISTCLPCGGLLYEEAVKPESRSGRLTVRQLERIHAKTGVPWYLVSREAVKEGL